MKILADNLALALSTAIETRTEQERDMGYFKDSAFVAGVKDVLAAVQRGEHVEVKR